MKNRFARELMGSRDIRKVSGTKVLAGSKKGPNVGILCSTHGNEQAPLEVLPIVLDLIKDRLRGNLMLLMVNPEAFQACKRFLDADMNRIFTVDGPQGKSLEAQRAREILPVFDEMDIALDLHTTPTMVGANPFTVIPGKTAGQRQLAEQLDVDYNVLYPKYINATGSTSDAFVARDKACITLELGYEYDIDVSSQVFNILRYLVFTRSIPELTLPKKVFRNKTLDVSQMEFVEDPETLEFDEGFEQTAFSPISKGQVIARADQQIYRAREDCYLIFTRDKERFRQGANTSTEPFVYLAKEV